MIMVNLMLGLILAVTTVTFLVTLTNLQWSSLIMTDLSIIKQAVADAVTIMGNAATSLHTAGTDPVELQALADSLNAGKDALAAAIPPTPAV